MSLERCPGCNKVVESTSSSESWHDSCYTKHRKTLKGKGCDQHGLCRRAMELQGNRLDSSLLNTLIR